MDSEDFKKSLTTVLTGMMSGINTERLEKVLNTYDERTLERIKSFVENGGSVEDFYFLGIYELESYIDGLCLLAAGDSRDLHFILENYNSLEGFFRFYVEKFEGSACCADKSRTIVAKLAKFFKDGERISFNYDQQYTYHLPTKVFTDHDDILEFYGAVRGLTYQNPTLFLKYVQKKGWNDGL